MTTKEARVLARWRVALRRIASGQLLGWLCLAAVFSVTAAYGFAVGDVSWHLSFIAPLVAAVALNACTWLAAIAHGQTRQLRGSWLLLVTFLVANLIASGFPWGRDLDYVALLGLTLLGFPVSLVLFFVFFAFAELFSGSSPTSGDLGSIVVIVVLLGLLYLQTFVLLPLLFEGRARSAPSGGQAE